MLDELPRKNLIFCRRFKLKVGYKVTYSNEK